MGAKLVSMVEMLTTVLRTYPALSAAIVNTIVIVCAHYGFNVSATQIVADAAVLNVLFGAIVHSNVIPVAKTKGE